MDGFDLTLVTGASGFVGSAVAKAFREAGLQVRVLIRASSPRINIDPSDTIAVGDICDRDAVAAALRGVRYLVHAAADYRLWAPSPAEIFRTNVEGTRIRPRLPPKSFEPTSRERASSWRRPCGPG